MVLIYAHTRDAATWFSLFFRHLPVGLLVERLSGGRFLDVTRWEKGAKGTPHIVENTWDGRATLWSEVETTVVWNGSLEHPFYGDFTREAIAAGQRMIYLEGGYGMAQRLQIDPHGVNAASTLNDLAMSRIAQYHPRWDVVSFEVRDFNVACRHEAWGNDGQPLPSGAIFVPLQLEADTQVRQYAPVKQMRELLTLVRDANDGRQPVIVKVHPSQDETDHQESLREAFPQFDWRRTTPLRSILGQASVVVTLNSSVGVEAMGFPCTHVITLGQAAWAKPGLTTACPPNVMALQEAFDTVRRGEPPNLEARSRFLAYLNEQYLVSVEPTAVARRLQQLIAGETPWLEVLHAAD